jgi:hypothetical protein
MTHVSIERFLQLSLGHSLTMSEEAHVDACTECAAQLAEENELSSLLGMTADLAPMPPTFVAQTVARYERARATQYALRVTGALAVAMVLGGLVALLGSLALAPQIPRLLAALIYSGVAAAKLANAGAVIAATAPVIAGGIVLMAAMLVALWSALLLRLWRAPFAAQLATVSAK